MFLNHSPIYRDCVSGQSVPSLPYTTSFLLQLDSSHFQDIYSDVWADLLNAHLFALAEYILSLTVRKSWI